MHRSEEKTPDVLTIGDLSRYLKISKSTLYKIVREGKIPSQKIGRHWRFRKVSIDRWLDDFPGSKDAKGSAQLKKLDM